MKGKHIKGGPPTKEIWPFSTTLPVLNSEKPPVVSKESKARQETVYRTRAALKYMDEHPGTTLEDAMRAVSESPV